MGNPIDVDQYRATRNWQCPICGDFSIGEEASRDHQSRCLALVIQRELERREERERAAREEALRAYRQH